MNYGSPEIAEIVERVAAKIEADNAREWRPLSGPEIVQGIDIALSLIEDRYIERAILASETTAGAIAVAKKECRNGGFSGGGQSVCGVTQGIHIRCGDREGIVTWRALVEWVRGGRDKLVADLRRQIEEKTDVQLTLF